MRTKRTKVALSQQQYQVIADLILKVKQVFIDKKWNIWADSWMNGKRGAEAAINAAMDCNKIKTPTSEHVRDAVKVFNKINEKPNYYWTSDTQQYHDAVAGFKNSIKTDTIWHCARAAAYVCAAASALADNHNADKYIELAYSHLPQPQSQTNENLLTN